MTQSAAAAFDYGPTPEPMSDAEVEREARHIASLTRRAAHEVALVMRLSSLAVVAGIFWDATEGDDEPELRELREALVNTIADAGLPDYADGVRSGKAFRPMGRRDATRVVDRAYQILRGLKPDQAG